MLAASLIYPVTFGLLVPYSFIFFKKKLEIIWGFFFNVGLNKNFIVIQAGKIQNIRHTHILKNNDNMHILI